MRKTVVLVGLVVSLAACGSPGEGARGERYRMGSRAMEPTITAGSMVMAEVVKPGDYQPRTGDVVVFDPPESWDHREGEPPWIFRVVAVPGDTIACCDAEGRIVRNGDGQDEPYVQDAAFPGAVVQTEFQPITVPAGEVYLLGDYREAANDSSQNGPVPVENVIGVVKF
ncbi:signal peptidase I [Micromonospora sp. NPDC007230]|uniref:signal peptidase I n=1 Tax=Micromonospora sp. NPDC007230 TaxID=3364237 RepID=UPI0036B79FA4